MAVLALLLAGCNKSPDPGDQPETPEVPEPPYNVLESDFYSFRDGLRIGGKLFMPEGLKGKKPAVILCTGLDASWSSTEPYGRAAARMGFVSCCFDFCGGPSGESLSEGEKADNSVLTEIQDVAAVYSSLAARDDVDPDRIFLMGGSQGGLVAALFAADNPSSVAALGLMFPAFNLPELVRTYVGLFGGLDKVTGPVTLQGHTFYPKYVTDAYKI